MRDSVAIKLEGWVLLIEENPYLYLLSASFFYLLGGLDELLKALLCLIVIDIIVCYMCRSRSNKKVLRGKLRLLIVIMTGALLDKMLGLDDHPRLSARNGLIYGYGYNESVSIINTLCLDPKFYVPQIIRGSLEKLKGKGDENEQSK